MYRVSSFWDRVCIEIHDTRYTKFSCIVFRTLVGTWVSIARSDLKRCSRTTLLALELVHSIRATRSGRAYPLPRGRPDAGTGGGQNVRVACNGCARGAYLRHQHVPDVAGAQALPRAGSVGPVFRGGHQWPVCLHVELQSRKEFRISYMYVYFTKFYRICIFVY